MQILDTDEDNIRMDEQTKVASDSSDGKCIEQNTEEDIIQDDAEPNILDQSQVISSRSSGGNVSVFLNSCLFNLFFFHFSNFSNIFHCTGCSQPIE